MGTSSPGFINLKPFQGPDVFSPYEYLMGVGQAAWANVVKDQEQYKPDVDKYDEALKGKAGDLLTGDYKDLNNQLSSLKQDLLQGLTKYNGMYHVWSQSEEGRSSIGKLTNWYNDFNSKLISKKNWLDRRETIKTNKIGSETAIINGVPIKDGNSYLTFDQAVQYMDQQPGQSGQSRDLTTSVLNSDQLRDKLDHHFAQAKTMEIDVKNKGLAGAGNVKDLINQYGNNVSDVGKYVALMKETGYKSWSNASDWKAAVSNFNKVVQTDPALQETLLSKWFGNSNKDAYRAQAVSVLGKNASKAEIESAAASKFQSDLLSQQYNTYLHQGTADTGTQTTLTDLPGDMNGDGGRNKLDDLGLWQIGVFHGQPGDIDLGMPRDQQNYAYGLKPGQKLSASEYAAYNKKELDKGYTGPMVLSKILEYERSKNGSNKNPLEQYITKNKDGSYTVNKNLPQTINTNDFVKRNIPIYEPADAGEANRLLSNVDLVGKKLGLVTQGHGFLFDGLPHSINSYADQNGTIGVQQKNDLADAPIVSVNGRIFKAPRFDILNSGSKSWEDWNTRRMNNKMSDDEYSNSFVDYVNVTFAVENEDDLKFLKQRNGQQIDFKSKTPGGKQETIVNTKPYEMSNDVRTVEVPNTPGSTDTHKVYYVTADIPVANLSGFNKNPEAIKAMTEFQLQQQKQIIDATHQRRNAAESSVHENFYFQQ